jgi:hypothetical protein
MPGPACSPAIAQIQGRSFMVIGNKNGEIKLYRKDPYAGTLPWVEIPDYFMTTKLSSYSRGLITTFQGKEILITGQQDGSIKAFFNSGSVDNPIWTEQNNFFSSLPKILHASPTVFDIDGDGRWELIVGDADGYVRGFRQTITPDNAITWEEIDRLFRYVKADGFAIPTLFKDGDQLYMFAGQQDGRVKVFVAEMGSAAFPSFYDQGLLPGIQVNNHSSPSASFHDRMLELSVGDYHGNLKHFTCRKVTSLTKTN